MASSLDNLFKRPSTPSKKRKLEASQNPNTLHKSIKVIPNGNTNANQIQSIVQDEADDDDRAAGPELPPEDEVLDDEDGRFFGGGITRDTVEVLDFMDERDKETFQLEKIDAVWLRKLALNFEKRITKNSELRAKFEHEPQKFMGSEADLDADVKALSILSEHADLYEEFAKLGCVASLVSLLSHENTDIAIDAIEIISELTAEDVEAEQTQWDALVDALIEADILSLLYENITRLNEDNDSDRAGVYHVLSVLENLSSRNSLTNRIGKDTPFIQWLLARLTRKESSVSQNKQYSAEVLAILLQSSSTTRARFIELGSIDVMLQLLSPYRKRDPTKGTEEEEFMENAFDCVTCCVDDTDGKEKFIAAEGIELCLIMLREGKMSRPRALRLLDHALGGPTGSACCEKMVEAAGLKVLFTMFMKKSDSEMTEHILGILSSMLRSLPAESAPRIRLLAKFVEKDYEKLNRLVRIRRDYASKLAAVDRDIKSERVKLPQTEQDDMADEWLSRRMDAGLYSLQTVDIILAWLVAEDSGAKAKIRSLLAERDESLQDVKGTIEEQLRTMDPTGENEDAVLREMLETLVSCL